MNEHRYSAIVAIDELAMSKNIMANNKTDYDQSLFDEFKRYYNLLKNLPDEYKNQLSQTYGIPIDLDLDQLLDYTKKDQELNDWFHKYANIPTLNFRVSYLLWVPKKVKEKQEKINSLETK